MFELRQALRSLRRAPLVSAVATTSLALAIAANSTMFSLLNGLVLRDLPVRDPQGLALIAGTPPGPRALSYPVWREIHARQGLFAGTAAWAPTRFDLASGGETQFVDGSWVSGGYFELLGISPTLGRLLQEGDDVRGGGVDGPVAVISSRLWHRLFGGSTDVIGRSLSIEQVPFTIVGVLPDTFFGTDVGRQIDVAVPFGVEPLMRRRDTALEEPRRVWISVLARLAPGQSIEAAQAAIRGIQPQIREATMPAGGPPAMAERYLREPLAVTAAATGVSFMRRSYVRPLVIVLAIVMVVLLIASANVANLLLARTAARRHELSVRRALGASRRQLLQPLVLESAIVASVSAAAGLVMSRWAAHVVLRELSTDIESIFLQTSPDWRVAAFTTATAALALLIFGVVPAWYGTRVAPIEALKEDRRTLSGDAHRPIGRLMLGTQVALAVVLVVAAGLFLRSFAAVMSRDAGFRRAGLLVVTMSAQRAGVAPADRVALYERTRAAVRAAPGVADAALSLVTPVSGLTIQNVVDSVSGSSTGLSREQRMVMVNFVSPDYFTTFGTPLLAGRAVGESDSAASPKVAVVNQAFAHRFLGGDDAIGHTISVGIFGPRPEMLQIVGISADAVYGSLREVPPPTMYVALAQHAEMPFLVSVSLSIRSRNTEADALSRSVVSAIGSVNGQLALTVRPFTQQLSASLTQDRVVALLAGFFGAIALLLAAIGLYGTAAYTVARRRTEIGVRMALGAQRAGILRLILVDVGGTVLAGIAVGGLGSAYLVRFVAPLLYDVKARDPLTFAAAAIIFAMVAVAAESIPAYRAARIDPAQVLREA